MFVERHLAFPGLLKLILSKKYAFPLEFQFQNNTYTAKYLKVKNFHKTIGPLVQNDLYWGSQKGHMVKKASKTI